MQVTNVQFNLGMYMYAHAVHMSHSSTHKNSACHLKIKSSSIHTAVFIAIWLFNWISWHLYTYSLLWLSSFATLTLCPSFSFFARSMARNGLFLLCENNIGKASVIHLHEFKWNVFLCISWYVCRRRFIARKKKKKSNYSWSKVLRYLQRCVYHIFL